MFRQFASLKKVHLVGIGGAGMSGIAEVLAANDFEVTGSDLEASEVTKRLQRLGLKIYIGHQESNLKAAQLVVISSAIPQHNVEVVAARERGIAVVRRAEMLAELMRLKYGIAVAGTHGKTTTTSMIGTLLTEAGMDPTVIVGGRLRVSGTGARLGGSEYMVAEADEYDRSFLHLQPILAVITSIEAEHLDTYGDLSSIEDAFVEFASRVPFFGRVVVCLDEPNIQAILPRLANRRITTYGTSPQADLTASEIEHGDGGVRFQIRHKTLGELGEIYLPMPGIHNVRNALAAVAVAMDLGVEFERIRQILAEFPGVHRRFERLGTWREATVVDDYAHHPSEVQATLVATRAAYPSSAIRAVFQPHLYSRTRDQAPAFGRALLSADQAVVVDIYGSREQPIEGVDAGLVVDEAKGSGHREVTWIPDWRDAVEILRQRVEPGDVIITLGAGDIYQLAEQLVESNP